MVGGIVEVAENRRYLSKYRGFLVVSDDSRELGRVPLDDVTALIISARQASLSRSLMEAIASRNGIIVVCGQDYLPISITFPYPGNYAAPVRIKLQAAASRPLCKRIWQAIVREKILNQSRVLSWLQPDSSVGGRLEGFAQRVKSGDPDNVEAQAARLYWSTFFGPKFGRNRQQDGENAFLNYVYTILRSAVARSVVASGLLPALGIHHHNQRNAFPLVDDLMEPYRPLADMVAWEAFYEEDELGPSAKAKLASVLTLDLRAAQGVTPLCNALHQMAASLVACFKEKRVCLRMAQLIPPNANT